MNQRAFERTVPHYNEADNPSNGWRCPTPESSPTLFLENITQVALYECELKGQISDGAWENSRPHKHWEIMCDAKAQVATSKDEIGINFRPLRKYDFARPDLVNIIGDRMIWYAKVAKSRLLEMEQIIAHNWDLYTFSTQPSHLYSARIISDDSTDRMYVATRLALKSLFNVTDNEALNFYYDKINYTPYSREDLVRDLKAIRRIVNAPR